jgi:serine phosphatase RsbU (regulator of sigma subunit)
MSSPVRAALAGAGVPAQAAAPATAPTESYRILLVEDDAGDALLVEELLADTGLTHTLSWTQTMAGALADLAGQTPDCVLLDLHLPDASGVGAIQTLEAACPHTAVIVLTGLAESRAGEQAVANGAQDYLVKGQVTADLLDRVVRYAVHRKQAERANAELRENRIHAQENTRLERGLLPAPLLHDDQVNATMRYLPGRQRALLGGDFLDVVQSGGRDGTDVRDGDAGRGAVHAVIGDVSGHGPDEAALGVCLRITWRALVLAGHRGSELLGLLEQVLVAERPRDDMFATCSTVTLDPRERTATVYLAGHHEPLLCADGGAREIEAAHGPALGIVPGGGSWRPTEVPLPDKGALLLYTDGLIEGYRGPGKDRLETAGLVELIARAPEQAADRLLDHLVGTAQTLNAGRHADDLAVLHLGWS